MVAAEVRLLAELQNAVQSGASKAECPSVYKIKLKNIFIMNISVTEHL